MLLPSYFDKFVSNIEPSDERVQVVADAHRKLREHLLEDESAPYPVADSFLAGSYARHTAHAPIKDVDILVVLAETTLSGDRKAPSPATVLSGLKKTIDEFYDTVDLRTQRRSIRVSLDEDDICMDVVPAIAPNGKAEALWVPDRTQARWLESHPAGHAAFATRVNEEMGGHFVRVAKAAKWWSGTRLPRGRAPKSFLLETVCAYHAVKGDTVVESFVATVAAILGAYKPYKAAGILPSVVDPGVPVNDLAATCGWSFDDFALFLDGLDQALATARAAIDAPTKEKTVELWQSLLGDKYPASLDDERARVDKTEAPRAGYFARLTARIAPPNSEAYDEVYPSNGRKLPRHWSLEFQLAKTNVPEPYRIKWIVRNHGAEARRAGQLYREEFGEATHTETTLYRGHHYLDCELVKDGIAVAHARHVVNIR